MGEVAVSENEGEEELKQRYFKTGKKLR